MRFVDSKLVVDSRKVSRHAILEGWSSCMCVDRNTNATNVKHVRPGRELYFVLHPSEENEPIPGGNNYGKSPLRKMQSGRESVYVSGCYTR